MSSNEIFQYNGFEWTLERDKDMTYEQAKEWVKCLGERWQLPSEKQLEDLYKSGIVYGKWGPFKNSGTSVWALDSLNPWLPFNFFFGTSDYDEIVTIVTEEVACHAVRAFAVRCIL